jgi:sugar lactone lactonase YvrE
MILPIKQILVLAVVALLVNQIIAAESWEPAGMTFDRDGNLFVADHASGQVFKFALDGTRSIFATEIESAYGVAFDGNGNLLVSHPGEILKIAPDGTKSIFTKSPEPANLSVDGNGNVYVPDLQTSCIFKITPDGKRSFAAVGLINPTCPVFDRSGNLYAADERAIYKVGAFTQKTSFATGVNALALVFDRAGNLLVSDKGSGNILKFTPSGGKSTYVSGVVPICFAFDAAGNLLVSDRNSSSILKFTADGIKTVFATGGNREEHAGAAPVNDEAAFHKSLEFTRAVVGKHHWICLVDVEPLGGGNKKSFRYDHYPEVERVQMKNGATFARKKDKEWLRSDDWAETGTKVRTQKSDELDSLIEYAWAPLNDKISTKDPSQGAVVVRLIKREKDQDNERLHYEEGREKPTGFDYPQFIFYRQQKEPDERALLDGWSGLMRLGDDERAHVNINYSYLFLLTVKEVTPTPGK